MKSQLNQRKHCLLTLLDHAQQSPLPHFEQNQNGGAYNDAGREVDDGYVLLAHHGSCTIIIFAVICKLACWPLSV